MSRPAFSICLASFALVCGSAAAAPRLLATNVPSARAVEGPDRGFDPVVASDEQRADFGFPPPPDAKKAPDSYAHWVRAMRASKTRVRPALAVNMVKHGAMRRGVMSRGRPVHGVETTSSNWSGSVLTSSATSFGSSSFWLVGGDMTVPEAAQPFNTCSGGWLYDSAWVGLDGATGYSSDVLQAGLDADAYCAGGYTTTNYDVWYEWAPAYGATIQNMTVQPGDELYIAVWALSATQGATYIVDENTGVSMSFVITPPSGTELIGNTAEFITERPEVGTKLATLARYTVEFFASGYVIDEGQNAYFAGGYGANNQTSVTMLDDNDLPISVPQILGGATLITTVEGSAQ